MSAGAYGGVGAALPRRPSCPRSVPLRRERYRPVARKKTRPNLPCPTFYRSAPVFWKKVFRSRHSPQAARAHLRNPTHLSLTVPPAQQSVVDAPEIARAPMPVGAAAATVGFP